MANLTPDLRALYLRVNEADKATEEAIAAYDARKLQILANSHGDATRAWIGNRDDVELKEIASRVAFRTSVALRLAALLQIELLASLVKHADVQTSGGGLSAFGGRWERESAR